MKYLIPIYLWFCIISCQQKKAAIETTTQDTTKIVPLPEVTNDYLITDTSFGKINRTTVLSDLENLFGKQNIQDTINYGAEGMDSFIVTKVFSNTAKEITIGWRQDQLHKKIASVEIYQTGSPYYTTDSIMIGSILEKLLQVNGKKINFYGTEWDYGGTITSYNKGKFDRSNIFFTLNGKQDMSEKLLGDSEFNTDLPLVKSNLKKLYVSSITLSLHK